MLPEEEVLLEEEVLEPVQKPPIHILEQQSPSPVHIPLAGIQAHSKAELQIPVQQFAFIEQSPPILIQALHSPVLQIAVQQSG